MFDARKYEKVYVKLYDIMLCSFGKTLKFQKLILEGTF